jgi:hypothetical protein
MSTLEINETEYCIKLSREEFNLTLIRQLIKRIQTEQLFFNRKNEQFDEDIVSKIAGFDSDENFDRLSEK